jgi:hypothetical protein
MKGYQYSPVIRNAQRAAHIKVPEQPNFEQGRRLQAAYESRKGSLQKGDFVFATFENPTFFKAANIQVSAHIISQYFPLTFFFFLHNFKNFPINGSML